MKILLSFLFWVINKLLIFGDIYVSLRSRVLKMQCPSIILQYLEEDIWLKERKTTPNGYYWQGRGNQTKSFKDHHRFSGFLPLCRYFFFCNSGPFWLWGIDKYPFLLSEQREFTTHKRNLDFVGCSTMSEGYYNSKKTDDICKDVCGQVLFFPNWVSVSV